MNHKALFVGLTTIDIQYFVKQFPKSNIKIKSEAPAVMVGGPATNAAVAFSYLNNGAHLATVVGENSFSELVKNDFASNTIFYTDVVASQRVSPVIASVVTSSNGDRNIFTHHPAEVSPVLNPHDLFDEIKPQIVMLDGFYPEFSIEYAKIAKERGIPVVVDCGSWKEQYREILKYTDVAICSADFFPPKCNSSQQVFSYLAKTGVKLSAISQGEKNILFQENEHNGEINIKETKVVDTLGAGDFLHGAFCYFWLKSFNFETALSRASEVASYSCRFEETRLWMKKGNAAN